MGFIKFVIHTKYYIFLKSKVKLNTKNFQWAGAATNNVFVLKY